MRELPSLAGGEKRPIELNALADEYLLLSYHGLRAKDKSFNAKLVTCFDEQLGWVEMVPQEIGLVLLNLFNNAFYATQQKLRQNGNGYQPLVQVSTCRYKSHIEIKVRDNGTGIPENVMKKTFQPFFTTKPIGHDTWGYPSATTLSPGAMGRVAGGVGGGGGLYRVQSSRYNCRLLRPHALILNGRVLMWIFIYRRRRSRAYPIYKDIKKRRNSKPRITGYYCGALSYCWKMKTERHKSPLASVTS